MSWWTTVAGLTPIAVHDADNVSGAQLLDCVGTNHITASSELAVVGDKLFRSVLGDGEIMSYASPVSLPTNCTICAFYRDTGSATIVFYDTVSTGWLLDHEPSGAGWYIAKTSAQYSIFGSTPMSDLFQFATLVKTGVNAVLYVNGTQVGGTVTDRMPPAVDRIGYGVDAAYNFKANDNLAALGIWIGAATQAEVISLEAACRAALALTGTFRGFTGIAPRLDNTVPAGLDRPYATIYKNQRDRLPLFANLFAGAGQIRGTVKKKALPDNLPLARKVRLYHDRSGQLVAETWSDVVTGVYTFVGLKIGQFYTALALDHTHTYRAVAANNLAATR